MIDWNCPLARNLIIAWILNDGLIIDSVTVGQVPLFEYIFDCILFEAKEIERGPLQGHFKLNTWLNDLKAVMKLRYRIICTQPNLSKKRMHKLYYANVSQMACWSYATRVTIGKEWRLCIAGQYFKSTTPIVINCMQWCNGDMIFWTWHS